MWDIIKNFHMPRPIRPEASYTVDNLRVFLREFRARPFGDFRGVNLSHPADNTWLMATRKKDEMMDLSDTSRPIVISFRAIHKEVHYFTFDHSWDSEKDIRLFDAALEEWTMQVVHLAHAWRCHNQLEDDMGNLVEPITMETTINDLIEGDHSLSRERQQRSIT
eukprot:s3650_g1.t1